MCCGHGMQNNRGRHERRRTDNGGHSGALRIVLADHGLGGRADTVGTVTLIDGSEVDSYSREWFEETRLREVEARKVLTFGSIDVRRAHLAKYGEYHGAEARARLERVIREMWAARRV